MAQGFRFGGDGLGDCALWPEARLLSIDGRPVALGGRAFDLLLALVRRHPQVVGKEALIEQVWPGLAVEVNNLQVQVWTLRQLLGAQAIVTVARRGYRFALPVQPLPAPAVAQAAGAGARGAARPRPPRHRPEGWPAWAAPPGPLQTLVGSDVPALRRWAETLAACRHQALRGSVWRLEARILGNPPRVGAVPGADDALWRQLGRLPGLLLLLDTHLAPLAARAVVRAAGQAAPALQVLATGLRPLGLAGEQVMHPPAPEPAPPATGPAAVLRWAPRGLADTR